MELGGAAPIHIASHRRGRRWPARAPGRSAPLRVDDWRVRTKLIVVLAVPMLGFLSLAGVQTYNGITAANELADFGRQVALGRQITALIDALQRERDHTAGLMAVAGANPARPTAAPLSGDWAAVDAAMRDFRGAAQPVIGTRPAYEAISRHLDEVADVRRGVLGGWLRHGAAFDAYSKIISDLIGLLPAPPAATDAALARAVRVVRDVAQIKELTAQVRGRLHAVCAAGSLSPGDAETLADTRAQRRAIIDHLRADATAAQVDHYDTAAGGPAARTANRLEQTASTGGARVTVDPDQWWLVSSVALDALREAERALLADAVRLAGTNTQANWRITLAGLGVVLVLLFAAVLTALLISRSMVDTLRRLRDHALDVAQRSLPELIDRLRRPSGGEVSPGSLAAEVDPVEIRSKDEVGELADAFTAVHRAAVRLAGEQAATRRNLDASLVNLARRSQILVERQLRALDELEARETDPDVLEQLFRVDHLATRMRRNDENLLVLAGADTSRRRNRPLPLGAVVLAATAEVEHYPRVRSTVDDEIFLVGHAAGDVIHLIAELLENATMFSPPDTEVTVTGTPDNGGAELIIRDEGMGMTAPEIADANRQLAAPASPDAAASERMGLVVVAHLAAKHRIRIELRAAQPGLAVHLRLPTTLLAEAPSEQDLALPAPWLAPRRVTRASRPLAIEASPGAGLAIVDAEEVPAAAPGGVWWSRDTGGGATAPREANGDTGGGRISVAGLPVRVPQARLPGGHTPPPAPVADLDDPDPDEVSSVLASFYRGVRRADELTDDTPPDHDDTNEIPTGIDKQGAPR
ncbi:sensor histidine kinase [Luedemannella helvata]|uniref:histidine kinase n=1 Tax=Luedemannella helvata TaxID=349315 RepID=A0ABP4XDD2_9ACTN